MVEINPGGTGDCGCCEGISAQTPAAIDNRPGLRAIGYRIGTHASFKQSLLAGLTGTAGGAALRALTTRDDDDFTVALLDAWATVGDVLTFYQERIANERYLRTATELLSLVELGRLIDYRPSPGVAAAVALAFTVDAPPSTATTPAGVRLPTVAGVPQVVHLPAGTRVQSVPGPDEQAQSFETGAMLEAQAEWNALKPRRTVAQQLAFGSTQVYLAGISTNLRQGDVLLFVGDERAQQAASNRWDWRRVATVEPDPAQNWTRVTWSEPLGSVNPPSLPAALPKVYALRQRAALFGHNAPDPKVLAVDTRTNFVSDFVDSDFKKGWNFIISGQTIYLDNAYPAILYHSWVLLAKPSYQELYRVQLVAESAQTRYAMTGKATQLQLDTNVNLGEFDGSDYRTVAVYAQSEALAALAERPLPASAATGKVASLKLATPVSLPPGRLLIVEGLPTGSDELAAELVVLDRAETAVGVTTLIFATALKRSYRLDSVTIYANVVEATHGERVSEPLGSGDGSKPYQAFTLRQAPLTYVSDATAPGGAASTLEMRVNDLLWTEVRSLYGHGPRERIYVTRRSDEGKTTVQFGDGKTGARLPGGAENVRASYRKGIGAAANVEAGQITTLLTRPLGAREVTNPLPATGGADPEGVEDARGNTPLTVLTLDRIVSLRDYEDFARAFAGIAKSLATWTWNGERRGVAVTVAGPAGAQVAPASNTYRDLLAAMRAKGDPHVPLALHSYRPAFFRAEAILTVDPVFLPELVRAAVQEALVSAFAFATRRFGQPVALSDVMAVMQGVPGVLGVDVNLLRRVDNVGGNGLLAPLPAALPQMQAGAGLQGAELLTVQADAIELLTA